MNILEQVLTGSAFGNFCIHIKQGCEEPQPRNAQCTTKFLSFTLRLANFKTHFLFSV